MSRVVQTFLCLAAVVALISGAQATTTVRLSNEVMTDQAELIVIGRAGEARSTWVGNNLVTLVTVSVSEVIKGSAGPAITVVLPGGIDANRKFKVAMSYPAAPQMATNEEVFLFLTSAGDEVANAYGIVGFSQGKFSIMQDLQGEKVVSRDLTNLRLADSTGASPGRTSRHSLKAFKAEISGYARRGRND